MTALPAAHDFNAEANAWYMRHHDELQSRARANFSRLDREQREEAVAEVTAMGLAWANSAARRGRLDKLTAFWLVCYASRQWREGRRFAGYSSTCAMSEATRVKHGLKLTSLEALDDEADQVARISLTESLADRDAEDPFDVVRRQLDYAEIMEREQVSSKARRTLRYLADTRGEGKQCELAAKLKVTPGRITQLKGELAEALARHEYVGPLGRRPSSPTGSRRPADRYGRSHHHGLTYNGC